MSASQRATATSTPGEVTRSALLYCRLHVGLQRKNIYWYRRYNHDQGGGAFLTKYIGQTIRLQESSQIPESQEFPGRGPLEPVRPFVSTLLKGRKASVTEGNRGIGKAITFALLEAGAKVWVVAHSVE